MLGGTILYMEIWAIIRRSIRNLLAWKQFWCTVHCKLHYFKILQVYNHKMAIATKFGHDECQGKELLFHRLLRTNCVNNIKFQVLNQVFYYRYWSHVTVGQSILKAFQCFQHPLCTKKLNAKFPLLEIIFRTHFLVLSQVSINVIDEEKV